MASIELHPDFKDFLRLLNLHQVEYILVGGYAVGCVKRQVRGKRLWVRGKGWMVNSLWLITKEKIGDRAMSSTPSFPVSNGGFLKIQPYYSIQVLIFWRRPERLFPGRMGQ